MKPYRILEPLPVKPENMPKIETTTKNPTQASIKTFQEYNKDQSMSIIKCDNKLGFLGMLLRASYFDPLKKTFASPTDPGSAPINAIGTANQITDVVLLYKYDKETFTTYCEFRIILIPMITNKCPEQYMTTLKHHITKFSQCEPLTLLDHLYTEYGTITSLKLAANFDCMTARWDPSTPINDIFQQINNVKYFAEEGNKIINDSQLLHLYYNKVHCIRTFQGNTQNLAQKPDIDKTCTNFVPFMTQQEKDHLNNQPTSGTSGFSNAIVDRIVQDKMKEFINQMGHFYQS